jgi:hypothetical protein
MRRKKTKTRRKKNLLLRLSLKRNLLLRLSLKRNLLMMKMKTKMRMKN